MLVGAVPEKAAWVRDDAALSVQQACGQSGRYFYPVIEALAAIELYKDIVAVLQKLRSCILCRDDQAMGVEVGASALLPVTAVVMRGARARTRDQSVE